MRTFLLIAAFGLLGCHGKGGDSRDDDTDATDSDTDAAEGNGYPSTFTEGKFRVTSFVLMPADQGGDVDGDGTEDNNLPKLLIFANTAAPSLNLSPDGLNENIAAGIADGQVAILLHAAYPNRALSVDVFGGSMDVDTQAITIDPTSLDDQGNPKSTLHGVFSTETAMSAGPDAIRFPVQFISDEPALPLPFDRAVLTGDLTADGLTNAMLSAVIPDDSLLNDVIEPLVPAEGVDSNGDGQIDYTKAELMDTVTSIVTNENMSDVVYDDGSRGISAAFTVEATTADF